MRVVVGVDSHGSSAGKGGHGCSPRSPTHSARRICARRSSSPSAILAIFRLGSIIPTPNVNVAQVDFCLRQATTGDQQGLYSLINLFSGGALLQLAIFALGIMPYITASIILQLLTVVIPATGDAQERGSVRADEDHPVHPLPHPRSRGPQLDRLRDPGRQRPAVRRLPRPRLRQEHLPGGGDDPDHDGRYRRHHVAGRAHHRTWHRQRHVGDDLHPDRGHLPECPVGPQGGSPGRQRLAGLQPGRAVSAWS